MSQYIIEPLHTTYVYDMTVFPNISLHVVSMCIRTSVSAIQKTLFLVLRVDLIHLNHWYNMIYQVTFNLVYKIGIITYIFTAISKDTIFKKNSIQRDIIEQGYNNGYNTLYNLIAPAHPINSLHLTTKVHSPPTQSPTELLAQYYNSYIDSMNLWAYFEDNASNLNDNTELDKFIDGCTHFQALINIAREDRCSTDPIV